MRARSGAPRDRALDALEQALHARPRLADAGIERSVGSVGNSNDNALAETINGLYETEVIGRCGPWRGIDAVEHATLDWVDWLQDRRILEPIGHVAPAEYETNYHRAYEH